MKTVQSGLNLQLDKWNGSSHTCSPLNWPKRWLNPATCQHPHRLNELATVKNGKPAVACYKHNVHQLPFKAPVDVLFWTLQSQGINWPSLSRSEMLSSLRHYMQAQSLGCHTINDDCGLWRVYGYGWFIHLCYCPSWRGAGGWPTTYEVMEGWCRKGKYSVICFQNMGNGHCDYNEYKTNIGTISKETLVKPVTDWVKCIYGLSPVHGFHLDWPELICCGN